MEPAQPLRFGTAARKLTGQGSRLQKQKRPEQQPLSRSSQQPLARRSQPLARRNRAFIQFGGSARPRQSNRVQKETQTPTFTRFPPRAAQKVAARKHSSQFQARTTPRVAKTSVPAAQIEGKRSQPLARKPGVAQKRKASTLTPAAARCKLRKVFDGSVSETQHLEYHSGFKGFCIRCDVQKRRKVYEACARHEGGSWLATGVRNGLWGLGCTECARFLASGRQLPKNARFSRFANFQVRPRCGFHARFIIEQHTKSESHRLACGLKRKRTGMSDVPSRPQPLACSEIMCPAKASDQALPASSSTVDDDDAALLRGNVPSPAEWKDAWAEVSEAVSLRKIGRMTEKKAGTSGGGGGGVYGANRVRKRRRKQLRVMAEVLRRRIRKSLSRATSISLALDECKYRKIIRFRCDVPTRRRERSHWRGASGYSYSGVLGLLDCSKKHASNFEEDHAVTAVANLDSFLTTFCTPLGPKPAQGRWGGRRVAQPLACDTDLKAHVMKTVRCLAADGASGERRAVFLAARDLFPNLLLVIRDPAHAIRIAAKALHCDDVFGEVWHELFDGRHALVPDLKNSAKWHNLLVAIQEDNVRAVAMPGVPKPLAGVLRAVSFAKQRFDSTADPVAKVALMILPVAVLLAHVASDKRNEKDQRERAEKLLRKLDTKFCAAIGVSADWGIICTWFLRLFDASSHDIALSRSDIDCMIETLDACFLEGRVFHQLFDNNAGSAASRRALTGVAEEESLPPLPTAVTQGVAVGFITEKVLRQLRKKCVFYAGGSPVLLWGEPMPGQKEELIHRLQNVASLTKERLIADFPRNDIRSALAMFDRRRVRKAFGPMPDSDMRKVLLRGAGQIAVALGLEETAVVGGYKGVIKYILEQMKAGQPLAEMSNQTAWACCLDAAFLESACPGRLSSTFSAFGKVIRFYISIEDGECTVERDFAEYRGKESEHHANYFEFLDDALMLRLNGPRTVEEFAEGSTADLNVALTPFSRECASLWRELYGARAGHYNAKATAAAKLKRNAKPRAFRATTLGVLAAARLAVSNKRRLAAAGQPARGSQSGDITIHPGAGTAASSLWTGDMQKFHERSHNNITGVSQTRARPGGPFLKPLGVDLSARLGTRAPPLACAISYNPKVAIVDMNKTRVCPARSCRIVHGPHRCAEVELAIVPDLTMLHDVDLLSSDIDLAVSFLYIVSLGVLTTTTAQLAAVHGIPRELKPQGCVHHAPAAANTQNVTFCTTKFLRHAHADVYKALKHIARASESKISLTKESTSASGDIVLLNSLRDVVAWACSARRVLNVRGPKAFVHDGAAMPT
jgi:hypothetical protein